MSHTIVIFGASGDLTGRKLVPALYHLYQKGRLPEDTRIVGFARSEFSHDSWRDELQAVSSKHVGSAFDAQSWSEFASRLFYHRGDATQTANFVSLDALLREFERDRACHRVYYMSTAPQLYETIVSQLGAAEMVEESCGTRRLVVEKPFGTDLQSARELNRSIQRVFHESQIYRIDHYLGKESVQNLFVLRFANSIFEPIWNRNYVDHVQITVAEEVPVGRRGAYYDGSGILRDMFQNHLLQLMTITAMEAPVRFEANLVRDEKVKVLRAVRLMAGADFATDTLRGQYTGYLDEQGVPPDSQTATFAAIKLHIDNWRWNGVPFYLRSGKVMSCRTTQIVVQFREPPHLLFKEHHRGPWEANRLVLQIQPAEGIQLHFQTKTPDAGMQLRTTDLDFRYRRHFSGELPDAYQRLLLDVLTGDASLFSRSDEVELAWRIIDPIAAAWQSPAAPPLLPYPAGQWGPDASRLWMERQGRQWFDVCPVLQ
jgi:glucose-6-phosphate 1-dehydrogenase